MNCCCQASYDNVFDVKRAKKELETYRQKGVKKNTAPLLRGLKGLPIEGSSLLDIGGGAGIITFELLKKGLKKSTQIDISHAYVCVINEEIERLSIPNFSASQGDFVENHQDIDTVDLVTLDKVICCYEDYRALVQKSTSLCHRWYAISIPKDNIWVKMTHRLANWFLRWRWGFDSFIHPVEKINALVEEAGFTKISESRRLQWLYVVYERVE